MNAAARTSLVRLARRPILAQLADDTGAVALEYGLIAALIVLAVLGTIDQLGESLLGLPMQSLIDAFANVLS
jgi:Flp pilus assembly pilin Flp